MKCAQFNKEEYALGLLEEAEETNVRAHLAHCELHTELVVWKGITAALAFAADERKPTDALRRRVLGNEDTGPGG